MRQFENCQEKLPMLINKGNYATTLPEPLGDNYAEKFRMS